MFGWMILLAAIVFQSNTVGWHNVPVRIGNDTDIVRVHVWPAIGTVSIVRQWAEVSTPDNAAALTRPNGSQASMTSWGSNPYLLTYQSGDRVMGVEGNSSATGFHPGLQRVLSHFNLNLNTLLTHQLVLEETRTDPSGNRHDYYRVAFEQNGYFVEIKKITVSGMTGQLWTVIVKSREGYAVLAQQQTATGEAKE